MNVSCFKTVLRSELDFQGMTVKQLSVKTGISQRTLEGYLSNRGTTPTADNAVKISKVLHVSVEYLVTGKKEDSNKVLKETNTTDAISQTIRKLPIAKRELLENILSILNKYDIKKE